MREYLRWLKPHRTAASFVFLLAHIAAGLSMVEPLFLRYIVDHVLLLEDGRVIERGTDESLMASHGQYYDMVMRQIEASGEERVLARGVWQAPLHEPLHG